MKSYLVVALFLIAHSIYAQEWVDTLYQIQKTSNVVYGTAPDFAGTERTLKMDICVPTNDIPPVCGRPLLIAIHGGAFLAGNKESEAPPRWMTDFAKRGYVSASVQYRLGMFQTNSFVNCNISAFGIPWNCLNMQDTSEWIRASYRAMQDVKGAIRFLVNQAAQYQIDPRNVFLVGESAGGFIALSTAFLDDPSEKPSQCAALSNVLPPNQIYENQCIQQPGLASSISSMKLMRPDLGIIEGALNPSSVQYHLKGVGNFYGGMWSNLFANTSKAAPPALYLFHQPNDLVVPFDYDNLYQGAAACYTQWPASCGWIINRPKVYGSKGIKRMIDEQVNLGQTAPKYLYDVTNNAADCFGQLADPSKAGHSIDNYGLRSKNMAAFFAKAIDKSNSCISSATALEGTDDLIVYPNPAQADVLFFKTTAAVETVEVFDMSGVLLHRFPQVIAQKVLLPQLAAGIYLLKIKTDRGEKVVKLVR